jgi:hypothetical protein
VKIHEWHRHGLQPAFGTIEQWLNDQLGFMGVEDEAVYAIELRPDTHRQGLAIRILVATDKGLVDMLWERPESVPDRHLSSRHYRWADVRGFHLVAETRLDPETLMRHEPAWRLEVDDPELAIDGTEGEALLQFWSVAIKHLDKG